MLTYVHDVEAYHDSTVTSYLWFLSQSELILHQFMNCNAIASWQALQQTPRLKAGADGAQNDKEATNAKDLCRAQKA